MATPRAIKKLGYAPDEWREMRAEFEREVKKARKAWAKGETYVIIPFSEFIEASSPRVTIPYAQYKQLLKRAGSNGQRRAKHPGSRTARAHSVSSRR
jgi:hypothetical protein